MVVNKRERDSDDDQISDPDVVKEEMARRTRPLDVSVDYKEEEESDAGGSVGGEDSGSEFDYKEMEESDDGGSGADYLDC